MELRDTVGLVTGGGEGIGRLPQPHIELSSIRAPIPLPTSCEETTVLKFSHPPQS